MCPITYFRGNLLKVREGEGHNEVERPVESGGDAYSGAPEPERIDLRDVLKS